jgi:death-on-curing protein
MGTPRWLLASTIAAVHEQQIIEHGGSFGVRDERLLESALARPENLFAYEENTTLPQLAAAYGFGIAKNHPFVDGNKRVAWVATRTFLRINGVDVVAAREEKYLTMYGVAAGSIDEEEFAHWLSDHCESLQS